MTQHTYFIHGLAIRSPISLPAGRVTQDPALSLSLERAAQVGRGPPAGEVAARFERAGFGYTVTCPENWEGIIRFDGVAEFAWRGQAMTGTAAADADETVVSGLLANATLSAVLELRGQHVLHASAVKVGGQAVAFGGPSTVGKSTLAAAACATGCSLVADDAIRLELRQAKTWCHPGSNAVRLRASALELGTTLNAQPDPSSDGRSIARPAYVRTALPLSALLMPRATRQSELALTPLAGTHKLAALLSCSRIGGWLPSAMTKRLGSLSALAAGLRVFEARVPKGLVGSPSGRNELRALLEEVA